MRRRGSILACLLVITGLMVSGQAVRYRSSARALSHATSRHAMLRDGVGLLRDERERPVVVLPRPREHDNLLADIRRTLTSVGIASARARLDPSGALVTPEANGRHVRQRASVVLSSLRLSELGAFLHGWVERSEPDIPLVIALESLPDDASRFDVTIIFEVLHLTGDG